MDQRWRRNHDLPDTSRSANQSIGQTPRVWHLEREVDWLRQQLSSARRDQVERAQSAAVKQDKRLQTLSDDHQRQLREQQSQTRDLKKRLADAESVGQERDRLQLQVEALKNELKHVACAADQEQQIDQRRWQSELQRLRQHLAQRDDRVKRLEESLANTEARSASLRSELVNARNDHGDSIQSMQAEQEALRAEQEQLRARVAIHQTDHEAVELVCADLDHYSDRLRCDLQTLSDSIDESGKESIRDRQESRRATHALESQLESLTQRLQAAEQRDARNALLLDDQRRLNEERNALLMEKDQDISALNERVADLEQQLDAFQTDCDTARRENTSLEKRCRRESERVQRLASKIDQLKERVTESQCESVVRGEQLRQIELSSKREKAAALMRADQVEKRFAEEQRELQRALNFERTRIETLLRERLRSHARQLSCELAFSAAQKASEFASDEAKQARHEIHQLRREVSEFESQREQLSGEQSMTRDSLHQQTSEVKRLAAELTDQAHQRDRLRHTLQELEIELQSSQQATRETELALDEHRDNFEQRLAQAKLQERERHDQVVSALRLQIERLDTEVHRLAGDREGFHAEIAQLTRRLAESELDRAPVSETRRLARELARHRQAHAREREFLYARLNRLHETRTHKAAA
ncbi:MAG: hypothetical protein AAFU85_07815 [Planctomycetota bacterium]